MKSARWLVPCACLLVFAAAARGGTGGGIGDRIGALVNEGRLAEARQAIARSLSGGAAGEPSAEEAATALRWLGRIEVAEENWAEARAAYQRLGAEFAESDVARDAATEIALLEALTRTTDFGPMAVVPENDPPMPKATEVAAAADPAPSSGVLVGAFGTPFSSAETAGLQVRDHLESKGIATEFEVTANQALRGQDAVLVYLLARTRELNRSTLVLVRSRWGFREFIEVTCYSVAGALLWKEKVAGGRSFRDDEVTEAVMDRLWPKLDPRLGESGLESG